MTHWLVYLHILGAFIFFMAHGVSMWMSFQLRSERNVERIRALLELSGASYGGMFAGLGVLLITGIIAGFVGNWWGAGWLWAGLGLLIVVGGLMTPLGSSRYGAIRKAVGLPYMDGSKQHPAEAPASAEEIERLLDATNPVLLSVIGFGGLAIILWLMMFKPF